MVKILEADHVQSQVLELLHQSPELRVVPHRRNDARITVLGGHDLGVINETGQQLPAFAPDDDPIPPAAGRQPALTGESPANPHFTSRYSTG